MTNAGGEWNIYLHHPISQKLEVVHNWDDYFRLTEGEGYVKIGRAQWRQLKREQKEKAKQLSHDLMFEQVKRLMG